jgi:hypothetical protein
MGRSPRQLAGIQLTKKLSTFYTLRRVITVLKIGRHWTLSDAK